MFIHTAQQLPEAIEGKTLQLFLAPLPHPTLLLIFGQRKNPIGIAETIPAVTSVVTILKLCGKAPLPLDVPHRHAPLEVPLVVDRGPLLYVIMLLQATMSAKDLLMLPNALEHVPPLPLAVLKDEHVALLTTDVKQYHAVHVELIPPAALKDNVCASLQVIALLQDECVEVSTMGALPLIVELALLVPPALLLVNVSLALLLANQQQHVLLKTKHVALSSMDVKTFNAVHVSSDRVAFLVDVLVVPAAVFMLLV